MTALRTPVVDTQEVTTTPEATNPETPSTTEVTMSPEVWEQSTKMPYVTKIWEATESWKELGHETQADAETISEYFKVNKDYRHDEVGYKDFIKRLEKVTETQSAPLQVKIKKISEFIRYLQRTA